MLDSIQFLDREIPWFFPVSAFVFGAIVGSFLNVCIYRIPAGKSIIHPGSTCACGRPIAWYDNLPILSWLILRGKARCCRQPYSIRYPAVELLTGCLFLAAWLHHPPAKAACLMVMAAMLVCASFIDLDHMEIPDRFSIGLAFVGFGLSAAFPTLHLARPEAYHLASLQSCLESGIGLLVGSSVILWIGIVAETILKKEAMGMGDVKLLGGVGAFLGWQGAVFSIFGGAAIGSVGYLVYLVFKKKAPPSSAAPEPSDNSPDQAERYVPFGPMLAAGALLYALFLESPVNKYFSDVAELFAQL